MFNPFADDLDTYEMEQIIIEIMEEMVTEFQMRWEPKSENLHGLLEAYTKDQLLQLCFNNKVDVRKSWKKGEIIQHLANRITETLEERILLFEADYQDLFIKFLNEGSDGFESIKEKMTFYLEVYSQMVQLGLIFIREEDQQIKMYVPDELTEFMTTIKKIKNKSEIKERITFGQQLKEVLTASIHLYGVVDDDRIIKLWMIRHSMNDDKLMEFYKNFYRILPILTIQKEYRMPNPSLIASSEFDSDFEALTFFHRTKNKMGEDYYRPTASEVTYYGNHLFDRRTKPYKQLYRLVKQLSGDPKMTMRILEQQLVLGQPLSSIMEELEVFEEIIFDSQKQVEQFAQAYIQLNNHTRLWENAGYTPTELNPHSMGEERSIFPVPSENKPKQPMIRVEKIGRNDPCPCGSGKKYKKCCMRK